MQAKHAQRAQHARVNGTGTGTEPQRRPRRSSPGGQRWKGATAAPGVQSARPPLAPRPSRMLITHPRPGRFRLSSQSCIPPVALPLYCRPFARS
jgi:hypothetical protein